MKVVRFLIALLLFLLLGLWFWTQGGSFLLGQENDIPPDILRVNDLTCHIDQHGKKWAATGIAKYLNHDEFQHEPWKTSPFPPRKSIEASAKDCEKWFAAVNRIRAVTKPVDVNDLKKEKQ